MLFSIFYYCLMQNVNYGEAFLYFYNITNNVLVNYVDTCMLGNYYRCYNYDKKEPYIRIYGNGS